MASRPSSGRIWIVLGVIGAVIFVPLIGLRILAGLGGPGYSLYSIPAGSMFPSVRIGDTLVAAANVYVGRVPPRGQIVVFKVPTDGKTDYVKRVIGLPGDRIQIRDGLLFINDAPVKRTPFVGDIAIPEDMKSRFKIYEEVLPDGLTHLIAEESDDGFHDNTDVFTVPEGQVFMLGDNRDNSSDSRVWGYVPLTLLRDKPLFVLWSTDRSRIGKRIE